MYKTPISCQPHHTGVRQSLSSPAKARTELRSIFVSQVGLHNWMVWCVALLEDTADAQCVGVRAAGGARHLTPVGAPSSVKRGRQMGAIPTMMLDRVRTLSDGSCRGSC